ncbi:MAG: VIT family protein [Nevskiaceae bacterium]|jgi:VIT1/CCC1 family predicted Fe2+/Mn2+ transporter|nr:VIT family protein [Nevskiaceae bacterium]
MSVKVKLHHFERHTNSRFGWLRAAVLGANDGLISTSSLLVGVAAANLRTTDVLLTGVAALVSGALSMATGEYVSVSAQADAESAQLEVERQELAQMPEAELRELTHIYIRHGLSPGLADQVARELTAHDALGTHAREELGITHQSRARPLQAAVVSALSFALGALLPILVVMLAPRVGLSLWLSGCALFALVALGALGAKLGGAPMLRPALRVALWGVAAMGASALVGSLFAVSGVAV